TGQIPGSVLRPVLQIAGIVAVASLTTLTAERAILILLVASLLSVGVAVGLLRRRLTIPARTRPVFRGRIWARSLVLLSVMLLCQRIYQHLGTVALQYLGTPEEVALYQPAVEALILTTLPAVALTTILMPRMRAALVDGDRQLQQRLITNSGRLIALCTAGISTLLLALGPTGLALIFGPDFAAAYPAVAIIAVTQVLASLLGLPNVILAQADRERLVAWVMSGGVLLSILASLALIPSFGPLGAALATGITLIGVRFVLSWICRRHLGLETLITKSPQSGAEQVGKPGRSA
ncbi:MAG: lipopolysaccharide biosynthesis protein, partial [Pseudomonadota bacterium]